MQEAGEAARRRELQLRAYAPGGELSAAELAELHELQNRDRGAPAGPAPRLGAVPPGSSAAEAPQPADVPVEGAQMVSAPTGEAPTVPGAAPSEGSPTGLTSRADADPGLASDAGPGAGSSDPDAPSAAGRPSRAGTPVRRRVLAAVAAVAALLGLAAGWLVFGTDLGRTAMTAEQQEVWSELEAAGEYDPGSIQLVGERFGATTWRATRDDAKLSCLLLTRKDEPPAGSCIPAASTIEGFELQVSMDYTEDGDHFMLWAMLAEDSRGDPVAVIQRHDMNASTWDWRSQYSQDELALAEALDESGFAGEYLQILGYDGASPVWLYQQDRTCLLAVVNEVEVVAQCGMLSTDPDFPLELRVGDVVYSVIDTNRGATLTVIRGRGACDPGAGACTSIDDKTGDIG